LPKVLLSALPKVLLSALPKVLLSALPKVLLSALLALVIAATVMGAAADETGSVYLPVVVRQLPACDCGRFLCAMEE
jgi:hypothetical protein